MKYINHQACSTLLCCILIIFFFNSSCNSSQKETTNAETLKVPKVPSETKTAKKMKKTQISQREVSKFEESPTVIKAPDGLPISANLYHVSDDATTIVLCHQAQSSKDEYSEIAPKLAAMGFNCLAIDQRSGGSALGGRNSTAKLAALKNLPVEYLDAEGDIIAAIEWASKTYSKPVVLVGSSYSATLALTIGAKHIAVGAVAAFSPGEYFPKLGDTFLQKEMAIIDKPFFLTSSKAESESLKVFLNAATNTTEKTQFIPSVEGIHGARALWTKTVGHQEYWDAFIPFLLKVEAYDWM